MAMRFTFLVVAALLTLPLRAQDTTNAPVAQPVSPLAPPADGSQPAQPPVALPANSPGAPPVALPASGADSTSAPGPSLVVANPAEARFDAAMSSYSAGQYADAVGALSQFIADFPQDRHREEALYRLAESYRLLKHTDDALAAYAYQVENYPDGHLRMDAELQRGAILFDRQSYADAIPPLQYVSDKGDASLQLPANYLLGRAFLATQKESQGRALLDPIANAAPANKFSGDAAQTLAALDDSQGKFAEALPLWKKTVEQSGDSGVKATAAARGGWSALEAKDDKLRKDAERLFKIAQQFDPGGEARKLANTGLLHLLFGEKRYSDWLEIYAAEKDKVLDGAREEILYDRGQAEFALKHWKEAAAALDIYLAAYPSNDAAVTVGVPEVSRQYAARSHTDAGRGRCVLERVSEVALSRAGAVAAGAGVVARRQVFPGVAVVGKPGRRTGEGRLAS